MYNDYTVTYESNINEFLIPILAFCGVLIIIIIIYFIALAKVFKKANRSAIASIIPIYNSIVMLEIVNKPTWHIILFLVPILNIVIYCQLMYKIAKSFRKTNTFSILTVLFPFIFIPILAFSDSEYIGINKDAMMGVSYASDKPIVKAEDIEATKPDEVKESKPLDISIGGGVYQKEYQESLLDVPEENKKVDMLASFRVEPEVTQVVAPEPEKTGADLLRNVEFIEAEEIHPSNFNIPVQVEEPKTITTDEVYNAIPDVNQNEKADEDEVIMSIEPIPTIIGPEQVTTNILMPNVELAPQSSQSIDVTLGNNQSITQNSNVINNQTSAVGNSQYVTCPNCGAVIKKDAPRCFMCGKER